MRDERVEHGAVANCLGDELRSAAAEAEGVAVLRESVGVLVGVGVADFDSMLGDQGVDEWTNRVVVADLAERSGGAIDDFVISCR